MKKTALRWMRFIHIILAAIWMGTVVCIAMLANWCFFQADEAQFLWLAPMIPRMYQTILAPVCGLIMVQGLLYAFFSPWGFKKHGWILAKWLLMVAAGLCTGWGAIGHLFPIIAAVEAHGLAEGLVGFRVVLVFILLQILILFFMAWLSVFKPRLKLKAGSSD